jgi:ribosomal protein S18 acetylase RimI-like enzyme
LSDLAYTSFENPIDFRAAIFSFLRRHEAENCLFLGVLDTLIDEPSRYPIAFLGLAHDSEGQVVGGSWMTPPFPLGLSTMPDAAIDLIVEEASRFDPPPTSVIGPRETADKFCERWVKERPVRVNFTMRQGIYQLRTVVAQPAARGAMRVATDVDQSLLENWNRAFAIDCKLPEREIHSAKAAAERAIQRGNRWLWEDDGQVVSMAGYDGATPTGIRIGWVYTPPGFRGRGYASTLVAALSQKLLDGGREFCFLFTDLSNPTSNGIYRRIGYEQVSEFVNYRFGAAH